MKYLAVLPRVVFPADTGAKIRNLNMFSRLSQKGDRATIVCYRNQDDTDGDVSAMRGICDRLELVNWNDTTGLSPKTYLKVARNMLSPQSYTVEKYTTDAMVRRITRLLQGERYDALVVDTVYMARLAQLVGPLPPSICFQHNVEHVILKRQYERATNPLSKAYFYREHERVKRFERSLGRLFDHIIMVSDKDCETMAQLGVHNTSSVPLGVDIDAFSPDFSSDHALDSSVRLPVSGADAGYDLVFTGSMDWLPNADGMAWFVEEVLPLVRQKVPVRLWIVGRRPNKQLTQLAEANEDIRVTGWVQDVRPYISGSALYVVPLRIGGGTRIKIFEAMAMGKPVVSTTIGAEGLPVTHDSNIVLADSAVEFAQSIIRLLNDRVAAARLGAAARTLVAENYSWSSAADVFADHCRATVERSTTSGRRDEVS